MDKALGWIIKGASVVITAPATVIVAGGLFAEVPGGLRWLVQAAAVLLVEGVFLYSWIMLEHDRQAETAYKVRHALTAIGLYFGLWALAWVHGEGLAGIVFRLALGAALLGTVYDAGVYDMLRANRKADRNIRNTWNVKRLERRLERDTARLELKLQAAFQQAVAKAEHALHMETVEDVARRNIAKSAPKPAPRMEPPVDKRESVPAVERGRAVTPKRKRSKLDKALDVLRADPHVSLRNLGDELGVSHTTAGRYIARLVEQGKVRDANGSGYEVLV